MWYLKPYLTLFDLLLMRRIFIIFFALVIYLICGHDVHGADKGGHVLTHMWASYFKAEKAGQTARSVEILSEIKDKAMKEHLTWDFYDASVRYVDVLAGRDWKVKDELEKSMLKELQSYGEPVLEFVYALWNNSDMNEDLLKAVMDDRERLESSCNPLLYRNRSLLLSSSEVLVPLIRNDYEYALWCLSVWPMESDRTRACAALKECVKGEYPKEFFVDYNHAFLLPEKERLDTMKALVSRYESRAVSLIPTCEIMKKQLQDMPASSSSEDYIRFRQVVEELEEKRKSYRRGIDGKVADNMSCFKELLETLEAEAAAVCVKDGKVSVALRNVGRLAFRISQDGEPVYEREILNESGNFYRPDTLSFDMPLMDDGRYSVECMNAEGKLLCRASCSKYTLSLASVTDHKGVAVYAADYMTGEPVNDVEVVVTYGKEERVYSCRLDSCTYLPVSVGELMKTKGSKSIHVRKKGDDGTWRKSRVQYLGSLPEERKEYVRKAAVMTDRTAFNPGDTVRYKAIVYDLWRDEASTASVPQDTRVTVRLLAPNSGVLGETRHMTNEFGSVAGYFVLEGGMMNGYRNIQVCMNGEVLGSVRFRVDSFVLPSFDLEFDAQEGYVLPGDEVEVSGKVISYSDHPVTSLSADVMVRSKDTGEVIMHDELIFSDDGSFSFGFMSGKKGADYSVELAVTDATGETQTFNTTRYVSDRFALAAQVLNKLEGSFFYNGMVYRNVFSGDSLTVRCSASQKRGHVRGLHLKYDLYRGKEVIISGGTFSGDSLVLDMSDLPSGLYHFSMYTGMRSASGEYAGSLERMPLLKVSSDDRTLDPDVWNLYYADAEGNIYVGSGCGPAWYTVLLTDRKGMRVHSEMLHVEEGLHRVSHELKPEYGSDLTVRLQRFFKGQSQSFTRRLFMQEEKDRTDNLIFGRFEDRTLPGNRYTYSVKGSPDAEMLVSVYDLATERIHRNVWPAIRKVYGRSDIRYGIKAGVSGSFGSLYLGPVFVRGYAFNDNERVVVGYGTNDSSDSVEEAIPFQRISQKTGSGPTVDIREDFAATLAFEPFLRSDADGWFTFDVNTSDKLSTFVISAFAHDRKMNTSRLRGEFVVTLPVKVSVAQPGYLYAGDRYVLKTDVSNSSSEVVSGTLCLEVYDTSAYRESDPVKIYRKDMEIGPGESMPAGFDMEVPDVRTLGFRIVFEGDDFSDGMFVDVPVCPAEQTLVETHSAVLLPEADTVGVLEGLRARFVNTTPLGAEYLEYRLMDMFHDMIPEPCRAESKDAISQSEAMLVNLVATSLKDEGTTVGYVDAFMEAADILLECADTDGGISWFPGGRPSPFVTALVLDRYAAIRDRGLLEQVYGLKGKDALETLDNAVVSALRYLDGLFLENEKCTALTAGQYLYVRSKYSGVIPYEDCMDRRSVKKTLKGMEEDILGKVMRVDIIRNLPKTGRWMRRQMEKDIESLLEYAVSHPSGGRYFPNAVMPWRGFIESEAYAHAMICDLFHDLGYDDLADGIRLWLMLQKETQSWEETTGFAEAAAVVSDASESIRNVRVAVLRKSFVKPFDDIRPSGNGLGVSVRYFKDVVSGSGDRMLRVEVKDGESVVAGEKIHAEYKVWSRENRSYVRFSAPRHACFRPVEQLSGFLWRPYGYREVKNDRTIYWIETLPEEYVTISEDFHVSQTGTFTAPSLEIETISAPHYRAAGGSRRSFRSE